MPTLLDLDVTGVSVGGLETCLEVPRWKLAFDIGHGPHTAVSRHSVLFTHAHMDHMGGVGNHCATRALRGMAPPVYVVPRENAADFERLFEAWRRLDRGTLPYELVPLAPGEEHVLPNGLVTRAFRSPHRVACQGYAILSRREKLREAYAGRPGPEIAAARQAGERVTHTVESVELAFTGDALVEVLEQPDVQRARRLVVECTFLDERVSVEQAREKGHIHLFELVERADLLRQEALLLTHASPRYSRRQVLAALDAHLPAELRARCQALVGGLR